MIIKMKTLADTQTYFSSQQDGRNAPSENTFQKPPILGHALKGAIKSKPGCEAVIECQKGDSSWYRYCTVSIIKELGKSLGAPLNPP
jgi:hypothetical protein